MKTKDTATALAVVRKKHTPPPSKKVIIEAMLARARAAHQERLEKQAEKIKAIDARIGQELAQVMRKHLATAETVEHNTFGIDSWTIRVPSELITRKIRSLQQSKKSIDGIRWFDSREERRKIAESLDNTRVKVEELLSNSKAVSAIDAHLRNALGITTPKVIECSATEIVAD